MLELTGEAVIGLQSHKTLDIFNLPCAEASMDLCQKWKKKGNREGSYC